MAWVESKSSFAIGVVIGCGAVGMGYGIVYALLAPGPATDNVKLVTKQTRYMVANPENIMTCIRSCPMLIHIGGEFSYSIAHRDTPGVLTDGHEFMTTYQSEMATEHVPLPKYPSREQVEKLLELCTMAEPDSGVPPPITMADVFDAVSGWPDEQRVIDAAGLSDRYPHPNQVDFEDTIALLRVCLCPSEDGGDE